LQNIYNNGSYFERNPSWHEEDSFWKVEQIIQVIRRNKLMPKSICEIGCGSGEILKCLQTILGDGVTFYGYEISPQAYEISKKKSQTNLNFYLKDLLIEKESYFDIVLAIDVIEHIEDYFGFLRNLREKGKYKIFHIPLDLSVQTIFRGSPLSIARLKVGHIHYFTKETALASLKDTGYSIIDCLYTKSSNLNRNWKKHLLTIPRKLLFYLNQDFAVRLLGGYSLLVLAE
jgi:SAM-dependent methyltransferase